MFGPVNQDVVNAISETKFTFVEELLVAILSTDFKKDGTKEYYDGFVDALSGIGILVDSPNSTPEAILSAVSIMIKVANDTKKELPDV